eukprot:SAG31_NODE_33750_length_340_cov_0.991701_1_plen_73_part_10
MVGSQPLALHLMLTVCMWTWPAALEASAPTANLLLERAPSVGGGRVEPPWGVGSAAHFGKDCPLSRFLWDFSC